MFESSSQNFKLEIKNLEKENKNVQFVFGKINHLGA